jgi:hypothetical protein
MAAETRLIGTEHALRRDARHTGDRRAEQIRLDRLVRRFDGEQGRGDVGQRIRLHHHEIRAEPAEAHRHAGRDAAQHHASGKRDRTTNRDRRRQQRGARLPTPDIL